MQLGGILKASALEPKEQSRCKYQWPFSLDKSLKWRSYVEDTSMLQGTAVKTLHNMRGKVLSRAWQLLTTSLFRNKGIWLLRSTVWFHRMSAPGHGNSSKHLTFVPLSTWVMHTLHAWMMDKQSRMKLPSHPNALPELLDERPHTDARSKFSAQS